MDTLSQIILLCVLIGANAFFVAAEMALVRIRRTRIDELAENGNKTAKLIQAELNSPDRFISACQLGITMATLALGATGEQAFAVDLSRTVERAGLIPDYALHVAKVGVFIIAFSITAFFQTVFGELLPKITTLSRAEPVLMSLIWPMRAWCWITAPFLNILSSFTALVLRVLRIPEPPKHHIVHSNHELKMLVTASQEEGVLEEKEEEMLHCVFDFSDTVVHEIMTPRTDMICVQAEAKVKDFVDLALKHGFSRIPVFEQDIDSIFGAVHIRDALRALIEHKENSHLRELARKILIVPENKLGADLLTDFKKTKTHMSIVVDEYGGTLGLVTMEDLIEELVGDIADEHEIVEEYFSPQEDGTILIDAKLSLEEASEHLNVPLEDEEFNTLGGHVFGELGREPQVGDEIQGEGYILRVEEADRHRILKLRFIKIEPEGTAEAQTAEDGQAGNGDSSKGNGSTKTVETSK
ncbi:MAG: hemolysin family protein [Candidatus Obscuribacterales bacterium]|nr:hemolysin family protein [Candidatus Obscuribacterales bacterium]